jgi:hypothetical protein
MVRRLNTKKGLTILFCQSFYLKKILIKNPDSGDLHPETNVLNIGKNATRQTGKQNTSDANH